jgi:hypothetical protein
MTAAEIKNYFRSTLVAQRSIAQEYLALDAIVDFISQALTDTIPAWVDDLTFQLDGSDDGSFCTYPDDNGDIRFWKTKVDDNINHPPPTNPDTDEDAYWIEVSPSDGSAIKEWSVGIYGTGLVIVYHNHSTAGRGLYILLNPTRPFSSTNIETEIAAGDWELIAGQSTAIINYWNFAANAGAFPTSIRKGTMWIAEDEYGAVGVDYVAQNAMMIANADGANAFNQYIYK